LTQNFLVPPPPSPKAAPIKFFCRAGRDAKSNWINALGESAHTHTSYMSVEGYVRSTDRESCMICGGLVFEMGKNVSVFVSLSLLLLFPFVELSTLHFMEESEKAATAFWTKREVPQKHESIYMQLI